MSQNSSERVLASLYCPCILRVCRAAPPSSSVRSFSFPSSHSPGERRRESKSTADETTKNDEVNAVIKSDNSSTKQSFRACVLPVFKPGSRSSTRAPLQPLSNRLLCPYSTPLLRRKDCSIAFQDAPPVVLRLRLRRPLVDAVSGPFVFAGSPRELLVGRLLRLRPSRRGRRMPAKGNAENEHLAAAAVAAAAHHHGHHGMGDGDGGGQQQQQLLQQQQLQQQAMQPQTKSVDSLVYDIKENLKLGTSPGAAVGVVHGPYLGGGGGGRLKSVGGGSSGGVGGRRGVHGHHRSTPYHVPPTSRVPCDNADPKCQSQLRKWNHQRRRYPSTCMSGKAAAAEVAGAAAAADLDDPFAMLQELITDGSLIKEAVRRLQLGLTPKLSIASCNAAASAGAGGAKNNRSFYDSDDDECRTPPAADYPDHCDGEQNAAAAAEQNAAAVV